MPGEPLVCPACQTGHPLGERFCGRCGIPLVHAPNGEAPRSLSPAAERARKVRPQYTEGPLVRVGTARHQAEAELMQGMLLEEGVPSLLRRSGGFDVPDFLASGPRDVLVPESGAAVARDLLLTARQEPPAGLPPSRAPDWVRALAVALTVLIVALVAAGLYSAIVS